MAAKPKSSPPAGKSSVIWAAAAAVFLVVSLLMLGTLRFGHDYTADALSSSKRVEFDLDYDAQSNAIPQNLLGEPLDMETAKAMAELRASGAEPAEPSTEEAPAHEEPAEEPHHQEPQHETPAEQPPHADEHAAPHEESSEEFTPAEIPDEAPAEPAHETAHEPAHQEPAPVAVAEPTPAPQPAPAQVQAPVLAPVEKQTAQGITPVIAPDGTKPWRYFARKDNSYRNKPRIAVLISGLGLAKLSTEDAIALPKQVTLSFSPYGRETAAALAETARNAGHELMLDLPMQTRRFPAVDPGPFGMRLDLGSAENNRRLAEIYTKIRGYVGLYGSPNDVLSEDANLIVPIIRNLESHGLLFVAGHSQPPAGMFRIQRHANVPVMMTDIVLDNRITETAIRNQLARAEDRARTQGQALVMGRAYPLTIDLLNEWLSTLNGKGFTIVPVSALGE